MNFWKMFFDQFSQSTIISGLLALIIWSAIIYLAVTDGVIPEVLYVGGVTVIAFFFGTKRGAADGRAQMLRDYGTFGGKNDG